MPTGKPRLTIGESSALSLSLVFTVVAGVAGGAAWAASINHRLTDIEEAVTIGVADRWTGANMRAWVRRANREVEVWSLEAERLMGLEHMAYPRFDFPDPEDMDIRGRPHD